MFKIIFLAVILTTFVYSKRLFTDLEVSEIADDSVSDSLADAFGTEYNLDFSSGMWDEKEQRRIVRNLNRLYKRYDRLSSTDFDTNKQWRRFRSFCTTAAENFENLFDSLTRIADNNDYDDFFEYPLYASKYAKNRTTRKEYRNDFCQKYYDFVIDDVDDEDFAGWFDFDGFDDLSDDHEGFT